MVCILVEICACLLILVKKFHLLWVHQMGFIFISVGSSIWFIIYDTHEIQGNSRELLGLVI